MVGMQNYFNPQPKPGKRKKKEPQPLSRKSKRGVSREEPGAPSLTEWFNERRLEMTGVCQHCGGQSQKWSNRNFHFSICHILPKAVFKSVATHKWNWIELCFWSNSCHTNMDNKNEKFEMNKLKCWPEIVRRFKLVYPDVAASERGKIPDLLLQELTIEEYERNQL